MGMVVGPQMAADSAFHSTHTRTYVTVPSLGERQLAQPADYDLYLFSQAEEQKVNTGRIKTAKPLLFAPL